jgi:ABC-2 type transport system ATP-binding protein
VSNTKTIIQIEKINDKIIEAVKKIKPGKVEINGNKIIVEVVDAEQENPDILEAAFTAGGRIQLVTEINPTLEEAYLKYVRSSD